MYRKYRYLAPNIDSRIVRRNIAMHRYIDDLGLIKDKTRTLGTKF